MPKLISKNVDVDERRVEDSTDGSEFVIAHNQTEADIAAILGLDDKQRVTQPIFGSVRSDGGIQLIRFKMSNPGTSPLNAVGIEFKNGVVRKRLSFTGGQINIWTREDNGTWTKGYDFETEDEPALTSKEDVSFKTISQVEPRQIVGVSSTPDDDGKYWWVYYNASAISSGYRNFSEMSDVSIPLSEMNAVGVAGFGPYKSGRIMMTNSDPDDPKFTLISPADTDTQQYGTFKSSSFTIRYNNAGIPIGWSSNLGAGTNSSNGGYDSEISITGDVYHPFSNFKVDRGVYELRVRLQNDVRYSNVGYFIVACSSQSGADGYSLPDRVTIPFQDDNQEAGGYASMIFVAKADNTEFRFECFCIDTLSDQQITLFCEIERIN